MTIEQHHHLIYRIVRRFLDASVRIYFKKIEVQGREAIPQSGPTIFIANHPNSLIDAFLIGTQVTVRKVNFIAKDSIADFPFFGRILRACGVVGVARIMDYGGEIKQTHGKNLKAIDTCIPRLAEGEIVAIFGEGVSTDSRKLGIIKKGATRIAFNAESAYNFQLNVTLIPVGINYSHKEKFRSNVFINIGEPFRISDLDATPAENQAKVLLRGTQRLQQSIEHLIVNFDHEELGVFIDDLTGLYARDRPDSAESEDSKSIVSRNQEIVECIEYFNQTQPRHLEEVRAAINEYNTMLRRLHLDDNFIAGDFGLQRFIMIIWHMLLGLFGYLLNFYGWVNNILPRYLGKFVRRFGREIERTESGEGVPTTRIIVARETIAATYGGWVGALVGYPVQIFFVISTAGTAFPLVVVLAVGGAYTATLVPAWRFSLNHSEKMKKYVSDLRHHAKYFWHRLIIVRMKRKRNGLCQLMQTLLHQFRTLRPHGVR